MWFEWCTSFFDVFAHQVHGNTAATDTAKNAARCLLAFGAQAHVRVYPGASKPLLGLAKHDPEIHGVDWLGGVQGLPPADSPEVQALFAINDDGSTIRAIEELAKSKGFFVAGRTDSR